MLLYPVQKLVGLVASLVVVCGLTSAAFSAEDLSGRWNFQLTIRSQPIWVIDFDKSLNGTLVSFSGKPKKYKSIRMVRDGDKLRVQFVQKVRCGQRFFEFVLIGSDSSYKGQSKGERADCSGDSYKSPQQAVVMSR